MSQPTCFDRSTFAALSDLQTERWKSLYQLLEEHQSQFSAKEGAFRSGAYLWPSDPLHTWSRIWEYPFCFHNIETWRKSRPSSTVPLVVDVGSGVTFFPVAVARLGCAVICTDVDPVCDVEISKVRTTIPTEPGSIEFRLANEERLPFEDAEADLVYCISVIEHIPNFRRTVQEIRRILKPGGLLILTVDLDLRGDQQLGVGERLELYDELDRHFKRAAPVRLVHPQDLLTSQNSLCPVPSLGMRQLPLFLLKQRVLKPLFRRKPRPAIPFVLAVEATLWQRRACVDGEPAQVRHSTLCTQPVSGN